MERVIKFRAFNKASRIMYYPEATPGNYNHYFQIGTEGFWLYNKAGQLICTSDRGDVLMQYTGLNDKNGREIYDGDILKSFSPSVPSYEVFYCKSSYRLRYKLKSGEYYDWGPLFRMEEIFQEGHLKIHPEIIGNIHDNPDLLNPPKEGVLNMTDPNVKQATEQEVAATESAAQDQAMEATQENAEEGTTEG